MLFDHEEFDHHERVTFFEDANTGLRAIIAIHLIHDGVSSGGIRFRPYDSDAAALKDVLRLSKAMTYKLALAGLRCGGAKSVIIGDPGTQKSPELLEAFGRCVESLGGKYLAAPDVGTNVDDMDVIYRSTKYVSGRTDQDGSTAGPTGRGVFHGMRAMAKFALGRDDLNGVKIAIQGVGGVGGALATHLHQSGAKLVIADVDETATRQVAEETGADIVGVDEIMFVDADILSPNALGGVLNGKTISKIQAKAICGAANNQLAASKDAQHLLDRGIDWAPDYVVSVGGSLSGAKMVAGYDEDWLERQLGKIYATTLEVMTRAKEDGMTTDAAAAKLAMQRLEADRKKLAARQSKTA